MNCGFEVGDISAALCRTGNVGVEAALALLNGGFVQPVQLDEKEDEKEEESLNDFVLNEYIRDFVDLFPNLLTQLDEFAAVLASVGVTSAKDRSRALDLLEALKRENEDTQLAEFLAQDEAKSSEKKRSSSQEIQDFEFAMRLENGDESESVLYQDFVCSGCNQPRRAGVLLTNCSHYLCTDCIKALVAADATTPKCSQCATGLHVGDIQAVCGQEKAAAVAEAQTRDMLLGSGGVQCLADCGNVLTFYQNNLPKTPYACPFCKALNCFQCEVVHTNENCAQFIALEELRELMDYGGTDVDELLKLRLATEKLRATNYECPELAAATKLLLEKLPACHRFPSLLSTYWQPQTQLCQLFPVAPGSAEHAIVQKHISEGSRVTITSCSRIQNADLWTKYQGYLTANPGSTEGFFWHGTRTLHPKEIYEKSGFDLKFARVGGCLWFAVQSTYSMGGYQHVTANGETLIILALVANNKRTQHVKKIRGDQILNVYANECTYPAYVLSYRL